MIDANELVQNALPSIIEGMKEELKRSITWQAKEDATKVVSEAVTAWVKENVVPEIIQGLTENKDSLIATGTSLGTMMVEVLTEELTKSLKKKLESSYDRKKIFESMF